MKAGAAPSPHWRGARHITAWMGLLLAVAAGGYPTVVRAGRTCEAEPPTVARAAQGLALAEAVVQAAERSGAQVLLLARAGQDLSAYGLRWSHVGWLYRDMDAASAPGATPSPVWRVVHKLNHCGSAEAAVYRQGLAEFFLDDPHRFEAALQPLRADLQPTMHALLRTNALARAVDEPRYNMLAYPWALTYQQSNQWAIETLAVASEPAVRQRAQAQAWLQLQGFRPTVLSLGPLTRLGARVSRANVAFDDHPNDKRFADRIETTTADSVLDWLRRSGLGGPVQFVR